MNIIAMISMFVDHLGAIILPDLTILRLIGRLAFPLYSLGIINGLKYSSNLNKYKKNILLIALLTQPIYIIAFKNLSLNVLFLYYFYITSKIITSNFKSIRSPKKIFTIILILLLIGLTEYNYYGLALLIILDYVQTKYWKLLLPIISIPYPIQLFAALAIPLFKIERIKINKYLNYLFYPSHLLILVLMR